MDNDFWLTDVGDPSHMTPLGALGGLRSPGLSSGYCSSEENQDGGHKAMAWRPSSPDISEADHLMPFFKPVHAATSVYSNPSKSNTKPSVIVVSASKQKTVPTAEKRNASFYIGNQQRRDAVGAVRRVPPRRQSPAGTSSQYIVPSRSNPQTSSLGKTMLGLNQHFASELGDSMSTDVDDCKVEPVTALPAKRFLPGKSTDSPMLMSRSQCGTLPTSVVRPLMRTRGGATLASCGTILRHSATVPNKMSQISGQNVAVHRSTLYVDDADCESVRLSSSVSGVSVNDALRDHMYALKSPPPPPLTGGEPGWSRKMRGARGQRSSTDGCYGSCSSAGIAPLTGGKIGILETFLRSTTLRFDANRGSTELALEELAKLRVTNVDTELTVDIKTEVDDDAAGCNAALSPPSLLRQILTGEVSEAELKREHGEQQSEECSPNLPVDSLLTDGFGLDANLQLDDPLSNGIGLLGGITSLLDLEDMHTDEKVLMSGDLNDSIQEQTRQEGLWWQHYIADQVL